MNQSFDVQNIRAVFKLAERARSKGNNPFAARLVSAENELLSESENTQVTDGQTLAHAEMNLLHRAVKVFDRDVLQSAGRKVQVRGPVLGEEAEYLFNIKFDQPNA